MERLFNATQFGKRLKKYRQKKYLSQMQLSELIGSSPTSVSHLENGTHSPSLETLIKLSTALGVGIDELLAESLPSVTNIHLDKDIAELLSDCSVQEKQILKDIITVTKKTLREHK